MKNHKTHLEPWKTTITNLEPWKTTLEPWITIKTDLEKWKTNLNPWKPIKTDLEPWKTNLEPSKLTWSWPGWLWGFQVVTGDSQEEVMIFRDRQTLHHNIYIIITIRRVAREYRQFDNVTLLLRLHINRAKSTVASKLLRPLYVSNISIIYGRFWVKILSSLDFGHFLGNSNH